LTKTAKSFPSAKELRAKVLEMAYVGSTVHIGCAFSIIEILLVLYRDYLRYPENNPQSIKRDYLVLSKGHGVMAQYACMHHLGWLSTSALENYCQDETDLKGLSDSRIDGIEVTSGSLGHGFSVGVGLAMGAKLLGSAQRVYAIVGDGEMNEGAIWEGMLFASHHKLSKFMVIVDANGHQAMGRTNDILQLESLGDKFKSFGFDVLEVDGHNEAAISDAISELWNIDSHLPKAIVARTVKGKGVSFMEDNNEWHYTRLTDGLYSDALTELMNTK